MSKATTTTSQTATQAKGLSATPRPPSRLNLLETLRRLDLPPTRPTSKVLLASGLSYGKLTGLMACLSSTKQTPKCLSR